MKKRDYINNFIYSINALKKNPVIYIPDLIYFVATALLSLLFLHFNGLTTIFNSFTSFNEQIREIASSSSLLSRLIFSLFILLIINLLVGWGTVTSRFAMIKAVVEKKKFTFKNITREDTKYLFLVLGLKATFLLIYVVPALILFGLGFLFNNLIFILLILFLFYLIITRFLFLFSYSILFLGNVRNPFKVIDHAVNYFRANKLHCIIVGLFVFIITTVLTLVFGFLPNVLSNYDLNLTLTYTVIYIIIKTLVDISVGLFSGIFVFKNYD